MSDLNTAPAEAASPDPGRADPDSPDLMPQWLAYLIALLILFLVEHSETMRLNHARRMARAAAQPRDAAQPPAGPIRGRSNDATTRRRKSPELSGVLQALLARLQQCDNGPSVWSQLQALGIVPGLIDPDPAAALAASVALSLHVAKIRRAPRRPVPAGTRPAVSPAPWRWMFARAATGPPALPGCQSRYP